MDILQGLQCDRLDDLRSTFEKDPNGLLVDDFVDSLEKYTSCLSDTDGRLTGLFRTIDYNGDERITWDEFTSYAIESHLKGTSQRPHERIRGYRCTGTVESNDTIQKVSHLKHWGNDGKIVTFCKGRAFQLFDSKTFTLQAVLPQTVVGCGTPTACEYIPTIQNIVTGSSDRKMRVLDRDFTIRQVLPVDSTQLKYVWHPQSESLFASNRLGHLTCYDIGKNVDVLIDSDDNKKKGRRTRKVESWAMHNKPIMDFAFIPNSPQKVTTCSLDGTIRILDLNRQVGNPTWGNGKFESQLIGTHENGVLGLSHCDQHHYLCSVGYESQAYCWVTNVSNHKSCLIDHSSPHKGTFVGIHAVPGTPEVITTDVRGYVKVWDLRMFKCVQTFLMGRTLPAEDEDVVVNPYSSSSTQIKQHTTMCYIDSLRQLVTAEWRRIYVHQPEGLQVLPSRSSLQPTSPSKLFNSSSTSTVQQTSSDEDHIVTALIYNCNQGSFVTSSGKDIKMWDLYHGCLTSHYHNMSTSDITGLCLDQFGRRLYIGSQEGHVQCRVYHTCCEIYSCGVSARHVAEVTSMKYIPSKRILITSAVDGSILLHHDKDRGTTALRIFCEKQNNSSPDVIRLATSASLSLFAFCSSETVSLRDISYPKKPLTEISLSSSVAANNNQHKTEIISVHFLGNKPVVVLSISGGRFLAYSCRPMQRSNVSDHVLIGRWSNSIEYDIKMNLMSERLSELISICMSDEFCDRESFLPEIIAESVTGSGGVSCFESSIQFPSVSCLCYDEDSHILWTGDSKGTITAWSMCKLFQKYKLHDLTYPVRLNPDGSLPNCTKLPPVVDILTDQNAVTFIRSWRAHCDDVTRLSLHPESGVVLTTGDDRRVLIWDCTGTLLVELNNEKHYPNGYPCCNENSNQESKIKIKGYTHDKLLRYLETGLSDECELNEETELLQQSVRYQTDKQSERIQRITVTCAHDSERLEKLLTQRSTTQGLLEAICVYNDTTPHEDFPISRRVAPATSLHLTDAVPKPLFDDFVTRNLEILNESRYSIPAFNDQLENKLSVALHELKELLKMTRNLYESYHPVMISRQSGVFPNNNTTGRNTRNGLSVCIKSRGRCESIASSRSAGSVQQQIDRPGSPMRTFQVKAQRNQIINIKSISPLAVMTTRNKQPVSEGNCWWSISKEASWDRRRTRSGGRRHEHYLFQVSDNTATAAPKLKEMKLAEVKRHENNQPPPPDPPSREPFTVKLTTLRKLAAAGVSVAAACFIVTVTELEGVEKYVMSEGSRSSSSIFDESTNQLTVYSKETVSSQSLSFAVPTAPLTITVSDSTRRGKNSSLFIESVDRSVSCPVSDETFIVKEPKQQSPDTDVSEWLEDISVAAVVGETARNMPLVVGSCTSSPGIVVQSFGVGRTSRMVPRKQHGSPHTTIPTPPTVSELLKQGPPGAPRYPAVYSPSKPKRPRSGALTSRMTALHLHALSNGHRPLTGRQRPKPHSPSESFTPALGIVLD